MMRILAIGGMVLTCLSLIMSNTILSTVLSYFRAQMNEQYFQGNTSMWVMDVCNNFWVIQLNVFLAHAVVLTLITIYLVRKEDKKAKVDFAVTDYAAMENRVIPTFKEAGCTKQQN